MKWITAQQLNDWSDSPQARTEFPALVASLIRASVPDISALRFPNGATGDMRGWDGHVVCDAGAGRVPTGDSYWELKTGKTAYAEGQKEFESRSEAMRPADRAKATYTFVASRTWNSDKKRPEDWVNDCNAKGYGWAEVRCLDAIAVEDWLEQSPAVAAKFARFTLNTMPAQGARSTDEFWEDFRHSFDPALVEDVLLVDRAERVKNLLQALQAGTGITQFISDSPDEAIAFGVAAIRSAPVEIREWLEAHTIVVDDVNASRDLLNIGRGLIFFLRGRDPAISAGAFSARGATLVPLGRQQLGGTTPYLERPTPNGLADALLKMDFKPSLDRQGAVNLARDCGRSVVALQRLRPSGHAEPPKWVAEAGMLLPALMAGAWDSANDRDKTILAKLAEVGNYYDYERKLRPFTVADDPPLDLAGTIWGVRAPRDAFLRVGPHIGPEVLAKLRAVMTEVFGDALPPPDPKAMIRLDRQPDGHSDWLRDGLANTLLQIAVWDRMAKIPIAEGGGQKFANETVAAIPGLATERVLVALRNQLPYLAEAAPVPLLVALEQMLKGNTDEIRRVFNEAEGFLHPVSYHTGLLWALETIAWEPGYFERAVLLLARLSALDPGGKLVNRPINSLGEIFLPWHPGTVASPERRLAALDLICKELPDIGWALLVKMMPTMHGISTGTARPKLREAGSGQITITYEEYWAMQSEVIRRVIAQAGLDANRWHTIVAGITVFAPADREVGVKALSEALPKLSDGDRKSVWEDLLKEVEKHERYAEAKWALPPDQLKPLRELVDKYASNDPLEQMRLLFDGWSFDTNGNREPVYSVRRTKLSEFLDSAGPGAVAELARQVQNSYEVVEILGQIDATLEQLEAIATLSVTDEPTGFTVGLLATIVGKYGVNAGQRWLLRSRQEKRLGDAAVARLCQSFTDNRETWEFVKSLGKGIESLYWTTKGPHWLKAPKEELLEAVETYLSYGRGIAALETGLDRLGDIPTLTILAILESIVREVNAGSTRDSTMISYETQKAFVELGKRNDVSIDDIARREISMLPLLEHSNYRLRLYDVLASNPDVYFDIFKSVFQPDGAPEVVEEVTEAKRNAWRLNYSILSKFHSIPGMTDKGVDENALSAWIDRVLHLAKEGRRVAVAENYIGRLLAHSPNGNDEAWPAEAVRVQLERLRSDEAERGMIMEKFNMRGAHFRSLYGGGDEERGFAAQYNGYADKMAKWPRTQEMLRAMAKNWEADARREDEWAEQRKMKM